MTILSNKILCAGVVTLAFVSFFLVPMSASARVEAPLCGQGATLKRQLDKTIASSVASYTKNNDERASSFIRKIKEQQLQVLSARAETDRAWKKYTQKLLASATSTEAKVAVQTFITRVENAREIQYRLDDASAHTFILGVNALLSERKAETLALSSSLKKDMSTVLDATEALCGGVSGADSARGKLQKYQKAYAEKMNNRSNLDEKLRTLQDEREMKRRASQQTFWAELEEAFTNLQSVLH